MLDQPENTGPREEKSPPERRNFAALSPNREGKTLVATPSSGKEAPRRKGPIVNRRGPSEVDRALRMSQASNGRPAASGRKLPEGSVSRGTVIRIDRAKGFGFLIDSTGEQRFFHRSAVLDGGFPALKEQQSVEFEAHADERGARALKVRPVGSSAPSSKSPQRPQSSPKSPKGSAWRSDLMPFRSGTATPTSPGRKRI